ncbi:MAG TPA: dephospho-CoA kinase [Candidatus Anaerotignum merdipullorum]|nr:dephospho-CoA kinase [Candidatus Anaerotignum merdipullorum]
MKVIGLTGGTGSGKSVVSRLLQEMGAVIVDADKISRQIVEVDQPAYREIVKYFGKEILQEDGTIFRRKLGEIVFHDSEKLAFLNRCTHTYIVAKMQEQIAAVKAEGTAKCIVLDAPLLFEAGLERFCDAVWVVYADVDTRAKRIMERDGVSYDLALARISSQKTWDEYRALSDIVLDNSQDRNHLQEQLAIAWKTIE